MPSIKLEDPEFVGDYFRQRIEEFCKEYPEINENRLREFCVPIQSGLERILEENRVLKNTLMQKAYKCIGF